MKRILLPILLVCFAMTGVWAQPKAVFDKSRHEFGSILWNEPALVTFQVVNRGKSPLFIRKVDTSCGCTPVSWTKEAIQPGATGVINASYDAGMLGHFEKSLAVYTNANAKPVYLALVGDVVQEKPVVEGDFELKVGELFVSADNVEFDDVNRGDMPQQTLTLVNTGKRTYTPGLMHLPKYLTAMAVPEQLHGGQRGKLVLTLDSKKLMDMGLTQTSVFVSRYPGDKVNRENEISVSAVLLPAFAEMTEAQRAIAPVLELSAKELDLGVLGNKKKAGGTIVLTNKGKSSLSIRSLQVFNNALNVSLGKRKLAPGESAKLKIAVVRKYLKRSKSRLRVLMITTDPKQPKVLIDVKVKP